MKIFIKKVLKSDLNFTFLLRNNKSIRKKFFKHLMDLLVESVKAFSISEKEILKRYTYSNPELVNKYAAEGRSIALMGAHQSNWEWSISLPKVLNIDMYGAYTKLNNTYYEKVVRDSREKFGVIGYKTSEKGRKAGYKQIKNLKSKFKEKALSLIKRKDIFL